jgi:hypothetical protein
VEVEYGETEKCSTGIGTISHLEEPPLLILLNLVSGRNPNIIELSLEFMFIDAVILKLSKSFLCLLFFALGHELARTLRKEDNHDGLDSRSDEENSLRDLI